jgi:hypothetical protein
MKRFDRLIHQDVHPFPGDADHVFGPAAFSAPALVIIAPSIFALSLRWPVVHP